VLEIRNLHAAIDGKEILKGLSLTVNDDGVGLPRIGSPNAGLGMRTMHFRASSIGGRLVIPVGGDKDQSLKVLVRGANGTTTETLMDVKFVPMTGESQRRD